MKNEKFTVSLIVALLCAGMAAGQQRSIVAGLEEHSEYRALIAEEGELVRMADSISRHINELRLSLRETDVSDRTANSAAILRMEEESFELRGRMARLAGRINAIEQQWVLENLNVPIGNENDPDRGGGMTDEGDVPQPPEKSPANLVYSPFFEQNLSPEQLKELRDADGIEAELPVLVAQYLENHARLKELAAAYRRAATQSTVDSIGKLFDLHAEENRLVDRSTGLLWETVFDSKSYVYSLLSEKSGYGELSDAWSNALDRMREQRIELHARPKPPASGAIADYLIQKPLLVAYETGLAETIGNKAALDSLKRIAAALPGLELLDGIETLRLQERFFLDYADVKVGSSPYNARNPIPEVRIWPQGVIYRVLVGNFSAPQGLPIFRNAWPLAVHKSENGRWRYYAGGFATEGEARKAAERLSKAGFKNPDVVVWMDGVHINPAASAEGEGVVGEKVYRVELSGIEELSPGEREIIGENEIVRDRDGFIVTPLDAKEAMRLRTALDGIEEQGGNPDKTVKLMKISE